MERIVAAIWARALPRAACVEFDWGATAALPEAEYPAFFAAWRAWLATWPGRPPALRLHGWRTPGADFARLSSLLGTEGVIATKELTSSPVDTLERRLAALANLEPNPARAVVDCDVSTLGSFVEAHRLLELHEWIDAVKAAGTAAPTLFDSRFSTARFAAGEVTGLCLATYAGTHARISALATEDNAAPGSVEVRLQLLRDSLGRLQRYVSVEQVLFDCPIEPELRDALGLASAGVLQRVTFPFLAP